jgi:hypothetical protein
MKNFIFRLLKTVELPRGEARGLLQLPKSGMTCGTMLANPGLCTGQLPPAKIVSGFLLCKPSTWMNVDGQRKACSPTASRLADERAQRRRSELANPGVSWRP